MYHHCHHQRIAKCLKKNQTDQRLSDLFVLTRNAHSLQSEVQNCYRNRINPFTKYKRVRAKTNNRNLNRSRISPTTNKAKLLFTHGSRSATFKSLQIASKNVTNPLINSRRGIPTSANPVGLRLTLLKFQKYKMSSYASSPLYLDYIKTTLIVSGIGMANRNFFKITRFFQSINDTFCKRPFLMGLILVTLQAFAANMFTQMGLEGKSLDKIDCSRLIHFATYYPIIGGCFQYLMVTRVYFWLFPSIIGKRGIQTAKKVACEQLLVAPFFMFPVFYACQEISRMFNVPNNNHYNPNNNNNNNNEFSVLKAVKKSYSNYKKTFITDNCANLAIWVPAQTITFGVLPAHFRLPWMSCVGFVWYVVVSW